jgi:hypothetical protein
VRTVEPGAPRLAAICAAVRPFPYRFETSGFAPTVVCVQWWVVELGLTPGCELVDVDVDVDWLVLD